MAAAVPTLPFVVLQAYKPSAPHDILAATTAITRPPASAVPATGGIGNGGGGHNATAATTMTRSSSSVSLHPPRSVSSDISHLRNPSSSAGTTGGGGGGGGGSAGAGISVSGTSLPAGGRLMSVGMLRSSTAPVPQHHSAATTATTPTTATTATATSTSSGLPSAPTDLSFPTNTFIPATVQARTLHPQVHYIFENDPLETEILESVPKSQCITMDFDPRSGVIKNVESYLTQLQVMDVRLVQSFGLEGQQGQVQGGTLGGSSSSLSPPFAPASGPGTGTGSGTGAGAVSSSSSASSLKATPTASGGGGGLADDNRPHSITSPPQQHPSASSPSSSSSGAPTVGGTLLARNNSLNSSTLQSSFKTSRRSTDKGNRGDASVSDDKSSSSVTTTTATTMATKDWTLVIDAVELDRKDQESDSQLLEQSMVSSLDTDSIPEDYLLHCEALMKSFSARNTLLRKVIDYANTTTLPSRTPV
ncbi:MAG: hypothetical protein JOS17DRAFT_729585 [Linnemannia elongata]|nr:MAG: hypothetical protein JOS17DRAFT_729585 [Linnemannia elongata]